MKLAIAAAFGAAVAFPASAGAADRAPVSYSSVTIAPDGRTVVALESGGGLETDKRVPERLVFYSATGGKPRTVALPCAPDPGCLPSSPSWSPDAASIVFQLRAPKEKTRDLYIVNADGSGLHRILAFNGTLGRPRFTRDGHSVAVLVTANARKEVGATQPGIRIAGEIGAVNDEQRIAVVDLDGTLHMISPPDMYVYEFDEGLNGFVGTAALGNGDNNWWIAHLFFFDRKGGAPRELYKPAGIQQQIAAPHVSPDGKLVAFIGGIMSDFGSTGGDIYVTRLDDAPGRAIDVTPNLAGSATALYWDCSLDRLYFSEVAGGKTALGALDFPFLEPRPPNLPRGAGALMFVTPLRVIWSDASSAGEFSTSCTDATAIVRQSFESPAEIAVGPIGKWKNLTDLNTGIPPETHARYVTWTSDTLTIGGYLLAPRKIETGRTYPLITVVHGGPSSAYGARFIGRGTVRDLLRRGYFVFEPNPRGSFGSGEAFTLANVKDFGGGDFRDIMSGIDAVEKIAPIDDARLGIMGGSYGGYMTMWAVTQTTRFRAAASAAGLSNWLSYYGENGIDQWMIPFFGASVYDDPAVYAKSSPITFIKNAKTPTLITVGELDVEVPAPQSLEFWHALETLGVPTSLVIYEGEGHRLRQPANTRDAEKRTLDWFDKYLGATH